MISASLPLNSVLEKVATCLGKRKESGASCDKDGVKVEEEEEEEGDGDSDMDDDDDDDDCYYGEDIDVAVMDDQPSHSEGATKGGDVSADDFFTGQGSPAAVHRLIAGKGSINYMHRSTTITYYMYV